MSGGVYRPTLLAGYKWARFFRFQYAVRQTAANRARALAGMKQKGRPRPRLVSLDMEDLYMIPMGWRWEDAETFARRPGIGPYYAVFMDGEYFVISNDGASRSLVSLCLDEGRLTVLPKAGLARW